MTTFLAIMLTLVISLVIGFCGTILYIVWLLSEVAEFRNFFREIIDKYSEDDED